MYCDIKNVECDDAGQITYKGCGMFKESEELHKHTICYKKGGYLTCTN